MTNTRAINAAAGVIHACIQQGKPLPVSIAFALEAAGLLNSFEHAAEVAQLSTDLDGARLSLWEEEQDSKRARFAAKLARQRAAKLRARVAELDEQLREALAGAAVADELYRTWQLRAKSAERERDMMRERVSEPYGCQHCGDAKRSHGRRWITGVGMHVWTAPTEAQVKDRMLARRAARPASAFADVGATRPVDEDPIAYSLTPEALHASSGAVIEIPAPLRGTREDTHDDPVGLHHDYRTPHDLPEVTS